MREFYDQLGDHKHLMKKLAPRVGLIRGIKCGKITTTTTTTTNTTTITTTTTTTTIITTTITTTTTTTVTTTFFPVALQSLVGQGLLTIEASRSHSDLPYSVGLPWTSDKADAQTST